MKFDLYKHTIFLVTAGSHAYGLSNPESDYDYRGIAIPPLSEYIGLGGNFEQCVDSDKQKHIYKHFPVDLLKDDPRGSQARADMIPDCQVIELRKFMGLALQNNPNIIEILFSDPSLYIIKKPIMDKLLENRYKILSKQCKARFSGYALSQLSRIRRHRSYFINPPTHKPTRTEFGLPESYLISADQIGAADALIQREVFDFRIDQDDLSEATKIELQNALGRMMRTVWKQLHEEPYPIGYGKTYEKTSDVLYLAVAQKQNFSDNFLQVLFQEKRYRSAKAEWDSYQHWLVNRNPSRAETEKTFGFDTKHASHLVRLLRMCREILETGEVNVLRKDSEELRAIRKGGITYDELVDWAEKEDLALNEACKKSSLPSKPDFKFFDELVQEMIERFSEPFYG